MERQSVELATSLLDESDRLIEEGRFAEAALAIECALELTLARCLRARLLGAVNKRSAPVEIEMLHKRYLHTFGTMSMPALQNVLITLATRDVHPQNIPEALDFVEHAKRYGATVPAREHYEAIAGDEVRQAMEVLRDATIVALCQSIVYGQHEPSREEVERERRAVGELAESLGTMFGVA